MIEWSVPHWLDKPQENRIGEDKKSFLRDLAAVKIACGPFGDIS